MTGKRIKYPMYMDDLETLRQLVTAASNLLDASSDGRFDLHEPLFGILAAIGDKLDAAIEAVVENQE